MCDRYTIRSRTCDGADREVGCRVDLVKNVCGFGSEYVRNQKTRLNSCLSTLSARADASG